MRADTYGTPTEQIRSRAGWINATTRRAKIRRGEGIPLGRTCANCARWSGNVIDTRALCRHMQCSTQHAALCDQWTSARPSHVEHPQPTRPSVE